MSRDRNGQRSIRQSGQEYARGIGGGLLFSLPLLYTMEVWWAGSELGPERLLVGLGATLVLLLGYNRYAGMHSDAGWFEVVIDSIEELGIGLLLAAVALWLLRRITLDMPIDEVMGKITVESLVVAIGVSVGTEQLGGGGDAERGMDGDARHRVGPVRQLTDQLVLGCCGAVLVAANVAPTEEIPLLASELGPVRMLALVPLSLGIAASIFFYGDIGSGETAAGWPRLLHVFRWSSITHVTGLLVSAALLWFFGHFEGLGFAAALGQILVLGLVATLGAAAGRLMLQ